MTGDLYPTKTRLALLDDVDAGQVGVFGDQTWNASDGHRKVTAAIRELAVAGWVERPDDSQWWRLTDAGIAIRESGGQPA